MNLHARATALGWQVTEDDTSRSRDHHGREVTLEKDGKWLSLHSYVVSHWTWLPPFRFSAQQVYAETATTAPTRTPLLEWEGPASRLPSDPHAADIDAVVDRELSNLLAVAVEKMRWSEQ